MNKQFQSGLVATLMGMGVLLINPIKTPMDIIGGAIFLIGGGLMLWSLNNDKK